MNKKTIAIICMVVASQFAVTAKTTHRKSSYHRSHASHVHHKKKHYVREIKDPRPEMTINDVQDQNNLWGIDISHHQAEINWLELANEKPHFMFIKASEGTNIQDKKYCDYYTEAKKLGIPVGSYHFFSYKTPGKDQAENFLEVAQHTNGDLLPVLDAEYTRSIPSDKEKVTAELLNFVNTIYTRLGFYPIIYCNYRYCQTYLTDAILKKCKLWIVDYKKQPECDWTLWQTTNKFKLTSIKGHVDLNFFNGNTNNLQDLFFQNKTGNSI